MKMLMALLLAILLAANLIPALAQTSQEAPPVGITATLPAELKEAFTSTRSAAFPVTQDVVSIDGGVFTITTNGITAEFMLPFGWMGFAQLVAGNAQGAVDGLRTAVAAGQARFATALAESLRRTARASEALALLDEKKPDDPAAGLLQARCLLDLGRATQAETTLKALALADPKDARLQYLLGCALHSERQWEEALAALDRASRLPDPPPQTATAMTVTAATKAAQELMATADVPPPVPASK